MDKAWTEFLESLPCSGGKSLNLATLRNQLPEGISLPKSIALPFGSFERVLLEKNNQAVANQVRDLLKNLEKAKPEGIPQELQQLRKVVLSLQPPSALVTEVGCHFFFGCLPHGLRVLFRMIFDLISPFGE